MKVKILGFVVAIFFLFAALLHGAEVQKTFEWEQVISTDFAGWYLYWGNSAGGPYDVGQSFIPYGGVEQTTYTSAEIVIVPDDVETTYYFVLTAIDTNEQESEYSNEVPVTFDFEAPDAPINFRLVIVVDSQ